MQMPGSTRFTVRGVSPTRMVKLFMSRHAPSIQVSAASTQGNSGAASPAATPAADLVSWVESSGGSASAVAVRRDEAGFGLQAAQHCTAGTTLINVPQRCHLTYGGSTDPRLLALIEQVPEELWGAKLALQVVAHRLLGDASSYAPYINNLPMGVVGLPMFFNGESLAALQYPPVTEQVKRRCRWLLSFTRDALAPVRGTERDPFGGAEVDANALGWALAVVTSRAFRTKGPGQPAAMLPLIDMANHSFHPNAKIAPGPSGSMCMVATRELQAGEPVVISYGRLSNDFLLMDYGFIIPNNPHDTVQLRFDPGLIEAAKAVAHVGSAIGAADEGDIAELPALPAWQQQALTSLQLTGPGANTEVTIRRQANASGSNGSSGKAATAGAADGPVDPRLLAAVRVLCAPNAAALAGKPATVEQVGRWNAPMALPAELAALRTLRGLCAIALGQFEHSMEEDAALLAAAGRAAAEAAAGGQQPQQAQQAQRAAENLQLAIRFRMDKKQLLVDAMSAISERVKQLSSGSGNTNGGNTIGGSSTGMARGSKKQVASSGGGKGKGKVSTANNGGRGFGGK